MQLEDVEKLNLKEGDVLIFRDGNPEDYEKLGKYIRNTMGINVLIMLLPKDQSVEHLNEDNMKKFGWFKK